MTSIAIKDIKPGMFISEDIKDQRGKILIPSGTELEQKHIRILKVWGIQNVNIQGDSNASADKQDSLSISTTELIEASPEIQLRFTHNDLDHPLVRALYNAAATIHKKQAGG